MGPIHCVRAGVLHEESSVSGPVSLRSWFCDVQLDDLH